MVRLIGTVLVLLYLAVLFVAVSLTGFVSYGLLRLIGLREQAERVLRKNGRFLSRGIISALRGRVHMTGLEHLPREAGRICVISNHQSYMDIPLLVGHFPIWAGFIAKEELRKVPLLRQWMDSMGCVTIKRGSARSSVKMILDGVKRIESGTPLIMFPEGTRSRSNTINRFKEGSLKLATRSKATIIPVTIQNTYRLWEEDHRVKATDIYMTVHPAVDTAGLTEEQKHELPKKLQDIIAGAQISQESRQ